MVVPVPEANGGRILVVDDDPMVRTFVVFALEDANYDVVEASDGAEALELIAGTAAFDALVTDIRMPNVDGWTLAERARELRPDLPVLYVSGWTDVDPRPVQGSKALGKPFSGPQLVTQVRSLLAQSTLQ